MINRQRINKDLKKLATMFMTVSKKTFDLEEILCITKVIFLIVKFFLLFLFFALMLIKFLAIYL